MTIYHLNILDFSTLDYDTGNDWESITCPKDPRHQRAGKRITDLFVKQVNKIEYDLSSTFLSDIIISDKLLDIFKKQNVKGYNIKPIKIRKSKKILKNEYYELIVTGKGTLDLSKSGISLVTNCKYCGLVQYSSFHNGLIIKSWDKSDIFITPEYPKYVLITERLKDILLNNNIRYIPFIESSKLIWPKHVIKPEETTFQLTSG